MRFQGTRIGVGVVAIGVGMAFASAAPASASPLTVTKTYQVLASKGSNPGSPFCKLNKEIRAIDFGKVATELGQAIGANNWPKVKKYAIEDFSVESKLIKEYSSLLGSLPSNVRVIEQSQLKQEPAYLKDLQKDTSMSQFNAQTQALSGTSKDLAQDKVVEAYTTAQCGSIPVPT